MKEFGPPLTKRYKVAAVDVLTFFNDIKISDSDEVVVKMDVEGAEYALCKRMIHHCLFSFVDRVAIEWHKAYEENLSKEYEKIMQAMANHGWKNKMLKWAR